MDLELVAARWWLDLVPAASLPDVARELLARGEESRALRSLAELHEPSRSQAASLFEEALAEAGLRPLPREDAGRVVARELARAIVAGHLTPPEGARRIAWDVWDRCRELTHLAIFVTLMERHEAEREHRDLIAERIRREAERLLQA